jgi:hypothetical protein
MQIRTITDENLSIRSQKSPSDYSETGATPIPIPVSCYGLSHDQFPCRSPRAWRLLPKRAGYIYIALLRKRFFRCVFQKSDCLFGIPCGELIAIRVLFENAVIADERQRLHVNAVGHPKIRAETATCGQILRRIPQMPLSYTFRLISCSRTPNTLGTAGNAGRNFIHGPHQRRTDLSLFKTVPLHGALSLQFRVECFNISNTPNFAQPGGQIASYSSAPDANGRFEATDAGNFGVSTSTTVGSAARQFQFAAKVNF